MEKRIIGILCEALFWYTTVYALFISKQSFLLMENPIHDKLTSRLKNVLATASNVSQELHHRNISTEHILYGMMQESGSLSYSILKKFGFTPEFIRTEMEAMPKSPAWKEELSSHARAAFEKGAKTAFQYHHRYIGTEHVLFGLLTL
ncbi:MAG: Clp protease N-terminal domain-containing protein, partial [Acidobacteriota bacterium]